MENNFSSWLESGDWIEFFPAGNFSYSDDDKVLRYKDKNNCPVTIQAPEGFVLRFKIKPNLTGQFNGNFYRVINMEESPHYPGQTLLCDRKG